MSDITRLSTPHSYSAAVVAGDYAFIGLHRGFGDTFAAQLDSAFDALKKTMAELGLPLRNLIKVNVWLKNINDLPAMEQGFNDYFAAGEFPARMTATTEFIDADCLFMIDGIAYTKVWCPLNKRK